MSEGEQAEVASGIGGETEKDNVSSVETEARAVKEDDDIVTASKSPPSVEPQGGDGNDLSMTVVQESAEVASGIRGETEKDNVCSVETQAGAVKEDDDKVAASKSPPSVEPQGGDVNDLSTTVVQESADAANLSLENETRQVVCHDSDSIVEAPRVGMVLAGCEEIDKYYRQYGMQQGFGVVKVSSGFLKSSKAEKRNTTWRCECAGQPDMRRRDKTNGKRVRIEADESPNTSGRPQKSKKCGCTAMIYATIRPDENTWVLKKVILEHKNHTPNPSKTREVKISPYMKKRMFKDMIENLDASQIRNIMANEGVGVNQVFRPVGLISNGQRGRLKLKDGDSNALLNFVARMLQDNQKFYHFMRHDGVGYLTDVLWVDARSRAAYEEFGDVVCIDTSYLMNDYDIPLAKFVGVNHHGQTILFGCALISHEDTETYNWLFRTWLFCMDGKEPHGILTDQSPSIGRALATVMPKTTHRWCAWDIVRNFPGKLGLMPRYQDLNKELKNAIYHAYTAEEFETRWASIIYEYQLQETEWLQHLFEERHMWVPAFTNHNFWAGMNSVERAQSVHGIFDGIVGKHTQLCEFLELYCFAMEESVKAEKEADDDCERYQRGVATLFTVEKLFQSIYTDAKFREVQKECQCVLYCNNRQEKFVSETELEYIMQDRVWVEVPGKKESIPSDEKRLYCVKFNTLTNEVYCDCKLLESSGIMCRHGIRLYDLHSVSVVPEKYILRRWRKDVKRKYTRAKVAYYDPSETPEMKRYDMMQGAFEPICQEAMEREDALDIVMHSLAEMKLRVAHCLEKQYVGITGECSNRQAPMAVGESENMIMDGVQDAAVQNGDIFCQDLNSNGQIIFM